MAQDSEAGWKWWAGNNDETFSCGPHATRDDAIKDAVKSGMFDHGPGIDGKWRSVIYLAEARQDCIRIADWIGANHAVNNAECEIADSDRIFSECDPGPIFYCTTEQSADLAARLKSACDEWQAAHGLVFTANTFSAARNHATVVIDLPPDEQDPPAVFSSVSDEGDRP